MKFNTKKEFAEALLEGREFKSCDNIIRFDENHAEPFRYGDDPIMGAWSGMELEEILPCYGKNKG